VLYRTRRTTRAGEHCLDGSSLTDREERLQSFNLEQRIPPSEVTLDLLKQLERANNGVRPSFFPFSARMSATPLARGH